MKEKERKIEEKKFEVERKIDFARQSKKKVIDRVQKLAVDYKNGAISYADYNKTLKEEFGERTPQQWVDYYESYEKTCKNILKGFDKELNFSRNISLLFKIVPLFFVFIFIMGAFYFSDFSLTGLSVSNEKKSFDKSLDLSFSEDGIYELVSEQIGKLESLKISGEITGAGRVQIYLGDLVVLDSEELDSEDVALTGGVITGFSVEGDGSSEGGDSGDSGSSDSADSGGDSGSSEGSGSGGSSDSDASGGSSDSDASGGSSDSDASGGSSESSNSEGGDSGEASEESDSGEGEELTDGDLESESANENEAEVSGEIIEDEQQPGENSEESAGGDSSGSEEENEEETKKKFSNYCKETCDLSGEDLNGESFELRFVVSGAEISIDKIRYEISFESEDANESEAGQEEEIEFEENQTEIELPENETDIISNESINLSVSPSVVSEFPDLFIELNGFSEVNLGEYFLGADSYLVQQIENISTSVSGDVLRIEPAENFSGGGESKIIATNDFGNVESNLFRVYVGVNVSEFLNATNETSANVTTLQYKAVINKPVKWVKSLELDDLSDAEGLEIEIPLDSQNVRIRYGEDAQTALDEVEQYEQEVEESDREDLVSGITGNAITDSDGEGFLTRLWNKFIGVFSLTGQVVSEEGLESAISEDENGRVVDIAEIVDLTQATEIVVEYYTDGPRAEEFERATGKTVLVSSNDEENYTDILSFAEIGERYLVGEESKIKIYWREESKFVAFNSYDLDENGYLDYVEWIVPHLSNQTFDIILITKAEHLNENRSFISDIYENVSALDGVYSEEIMEGHFVRVTFEQNLTNEKDITIYPRVISGTPQVVVYEKDENETIVVFENLTDGENKVYLTTLNGTQDVFDLLILNGSLEFDYIVDPSIVITDVSVEGTLYNITAEPGFTHLNISNSNISLYMPFDANVSSGVTYDYSEKNHDGIYVNGAYWNDSGIIGGAAVFDGVDDRINFSISSAYNFGTESFVVMAWIRNQGSANDFFIDNKAAGANTAGYNIYKQTATTVRFRIANGTAQASSGTSTGVTINDGAWHHLAGKRNETGIYLFIDGSQNIQNLGVHGAWNVTNTNTRLHLGSTSAGALHLNGSMDEVLFYRGELSNTQISEIFSNQSSRFFSRGEHIFVNKNVSGDGSENRINITINSSMLFGSRINVSVGSESGGSYTYGSEYSFTNNFVSGIPVTTPNNISLKFIFYAGNSTNPFISPALISPVNITSYSVDGTAPVVNLIAPTNGTSSSGATHSFNATFSDAVGLSNATFYLWNSTNDLINTTNGSLSGTSGSMNLSVTLPYPGTFLWNYLATDTNNNRAFNNTNYTVVYSSSNVAPYTVLNFPANSSVYWRGMFNLTLNATAYDIDADSMVARIFAGNYTYSASQLYQHGLIYQRDSLADNSEMIYNFTSLPVFPDSSTVLLMHFDNRSEYGENQTHVYDFSGNGNNGTIINQPRVNMSGGKFGGAIYFKTDYSTIQSVEVLDNTILDFTSNFTLSAWVRPEGAGTKQFVFDKTNDDADGFFVLYDFGTKSLNFSNGTNTISTSSDSLLLGNWSHVLVVSDSSSGTDIYINGINQSTTGASEPKILTASDDEISIGAATFSLTATDGFNGTIDEVAIWNRTLSATEIKNLYRLNANKYIWKVNLTDDSGTSNESETREIIIRDTMVNVESSQSCVDLYNFANLIGQGYDCGVAGTTCLGLNYDLNVTSGNTLSLNASCILYFNASSDGALNLFAHGVLNLSGANVTANSSGAKFDFSSFVSQPFARGSYGNFSLANFDRHTNITDSRINFYGIDVKENRTVLLNSTDFSSYAIEGGSLERQFRLNVSTYSSGAIITGVNVTARNVSNSIIFSKSSGSDGAAYHNLTQYLDAGSGKVYQSNYTINVTKTSYFPNSTSFNLTGETSVGLTLNDFDNIEITGTETLHDIYTRINDPVTFANLSDGTRSCRYVAEADINVSTGTLVMEGCTLEMNNSGADGANSIYITGALRANYSNFTVSALNDFYDFQALTGSSLTLRNSFVSFMGHSVSDLESGLAINTTNITFENNTLSMGYDTDIEILSSNIVLKGSRFLGGGTYNLRCIQCTNVTIQDSNLSGSAGASITVAANQSLNVLNTNYTSVSVHATGRLYRQWYVDGIVRNSGGSGISGVNVTFYNRTGGLSYSSLTNSSGGIVRQNVTEYVINSTQVTYQTNYTINATKIGYEVGTQSHNVTTNMNFSFVLSGGVTPGIVLDAPENASNHNLNSNVSLKVNVSDTYNDLVDIFIYGVNSTSSAQMFGHGLLYQKLDAVNGENITYNWTAPTVIPDASTVLLYHFDNRSVYSENQTLVVDYSGSSNHGNTNGNAAPNMTGGKFAGGFMFDGNGDYVSANGQNELSLNTNYTWSAWIKPESSSLVASGIIGKNSLVEAYGIGIFNTNLIMVAPTNPEGQYVVGSKAITSRNWTHIAVTFNFNTLTSYLYVNGVLDTSGDMSSIQSDSGSDLLIGRAANCDNGGCTLVGYYDFNGTIDEVAVWNRTLSATEVQDLYRLKIDKYYWKVNATDYSGFSNESVTREFNVVDSNSAPQIVSVSSIGAVSPTENGVQSVSFSFIMNDSNGVADLNDTSVRANFTRGGEVARQNSSCTLVGDLDSVSANYSCTIGMWYFDGAGSWNVTVYGADVAGLSAQNSTTTFNYGELSSFVLSPATLSWGSVTQGQVNVSTNAGSPISTTLNNTGNYNVVGVNITAIDLYGASNPSYKIPAANITVWADDSESPNKCISDLLVNGTSVNMTGVTLNRGNHSVNNGDIGQEYLYYCITQVPANIPSQVYSTSIGGSWIVRIFAATLVLGGAGRKKRKKLVEELVEKYGESLKEFLEIGEEIKERYGLELSQVKKLVAERESDVEVPISIFSEEIGAAEALCKYLKENKKLTYSEIAKHIGRDQRTVWVNYRNASRKMTDKFRDKDGFSVSVRIFARGEHSILEALISYLRDKGFKNVEIAKMLNKDARNVWTMYSRAVKKGR